METIVVGVDGSEGSKHALEWAAGEARRRGAALRVVLAWQAPAKLLPGSGWVPTPDEGLIAEVQGFARRRLDELCAATAASLDGLEVERSVVEGDAVQVLVDAACSADLLVVGTRGHGGLAGLVLGSVSRQCAHHSPCPVVVVPPQAA
jgi:nucleotide-binding universal stress UspA family protein